MDNIKHIKIKNPKILRLLLIIIILFVLGTGSTYAYLSYSANGGSLTGNMANVNLSLSVTKVLPTTNGVDDIIINKFSNLAESLNNDCAYDSDYALCQLYRINLSNSSNGLSTNVTGSISFENENTPNLSWIVLNNYNSSATYTSSMMGDDFNTANSTFTKFIDSYLLASGSSVSFYILVWVNEVDTVQTDEGAYNATVRFEDANGKGVTATFDGYRFTTSDNDDGNDSSSSEVDGYTLFHWYQGMEALDEYDQVLGHEGSMMYKFSDEIYNSDVLIGSNLILTYKDGHVDTFTIFENQSDTYEGENSLTVSGTDMMLGIWFIMFYGQNNSSGFNPGVWIVFAENTEDTYPLSDIKIVVPGEKILTWKSGSELEKITLEDSMQVNGGMYDINLLKFSNDDSLSASDLIGKTAIMKNNPFTGNTVWKQVIDNSMSSLFIISDGTYNFYGNTLSKGVWFTDVPIDMDGVVLNYSSIIKEWAIMK